MNIFTLGKADVPDCDTRLNIPLEGKRNALISIVDPGDKPPRRPVNVPASNHYIVYFHDISDDFPTYKYTLPAREHIEGIFYFFNQIKESVDNLIVHCFAGISRSTATTFALHCILLGEGREKEALDAMKKSAAFGGPRPNKRIIRIADEILDRRGIMVSVIEEFQNGVDQKLREKFGNIDHLFIN